MYANQRHLKAMALSMQQKYYTSNRTQNCPILKKLAKASLNKIKYIYDVQCKMWKHLSNKEINAARLSERLPIKPTKSGGGQSHIRSRLCKRNKRDVDGKINDEVK